MQYHPGPAFIEYTALSLLDSKSFKRLMMLPHGVIVKEVDDVQVGVVAPVDHVLVVVEVAGVLWRLDVEVPLKIRSRSDFRTSPVAVGGHLSGSELGPYSTGRGRDGRAKLGPNNLRYYNIYNIITLSYYSIIIL